MEIQGFGPTATTYFCPCDQKTGNLESFYFYDDSSTLTSLLLVLSFLSSSVLSFFAPFFCSNLTAGEFGESFVRSLLTFDP